MCVCARACVRVCGVCVRVCACVRVHRKTVTGESPSHVLSVIIMKRHHSVHHNKFTIIKFLPLRRARR